MIMITDRYFNMMILKFLFVLFGLLAECEQFRPDRGAFLFSLVDPDGTGPQKIGRSPRMNGGIQCSRNWGPSFGLYSDADHHYSSYALRFWGQDNQFYGSFHLGGGFECPNIDRWMSPDFGGNQCSFNELEVFQVNY